MTVCIEFILFSTSSVNGGLLDNTPGQPARRSPTAGMVESGYRTTRILTATPYPLPDLGRSKSTDSTRPTPVVRGRHGNFPRAVVRGGAPGIQSAGTTGADRWPKECCSETQSHVVADFPAESLHSGFQRLAAFDHGALRRDGSREPAAGRPRGEVRVRVRLRDALDRALDPHLPPERVPVEDERRPRVLGQLAALAALVAREEVRPRSSTSLSSTIRADGRAVAGCGRERDRVGPTPAPARLGAPAPQLRKRVGVEVALEQRAIALVVPRGESMLGWCASCSSLASRGLAATVTRERGAGGLQCRGREGGDPRDAAADDAARPGAVRVVPASVDRVICHDFTRDGRTDWP